MVRRCCVANCTESDLTILAHRFPKGDEMALKWQQVLNLSNERIQILRMSAVVCTKHFSSSSYRNAISNSLNANAVPNLKDNEDNERIVTTKIKDQRIKKDIPLRCHKSPRSVLNKTEPTASTTVKRESISPVKRKNIVEEISFDNEIPLEQPSKKAKEKSPVKILNSCIPEKLARIISNEMRIIPESPTKMTQTEIRHIDKEVQTDRIDEEEAATIKPTVSKDDKLISLLYPDFDGKSKIELIKMIIERNQKIKILEEEKALIEDAMNKLL